MKSYTSVHSKISLNLTKLEAVRKYFIAKHYFGRIGLGILVVPFALVILFSIGCAIVGSDCRLLNLIMMNMADFLGFVFSLSPFSDTTTYFVLYGFIILLVLGILFYLFKQTKNINKLKDKIIKIMVHHIDDTVKYKQQLIKPEETRESGFFEDKKTKMNTNLYFNGHAIETSDKVNVRFAEIRNVPLKGRLNLMLSEYTLRIPGLGTILILIYMSYILLLRGLFRKRASDAYLGFNGLFIVADFPKKIKTKVFVFPDILEKELGYLAPALQKMKYKNKQLVRLENLEFEKSFVVYAFDQMEARYILTPSFMEEILKIRKKINKSMMLSFSKNKMYITIRDNEGYVTLNLMKSMLKSDEAERVYENISHIFEIINLFKLNRKIWG